MSPTALLYIVANSQLPKCNSELLAHSPFPSDPAFPRESQEFYVELGLNNVSLKHINKIDFVNTSKFSLALRY